MQMIETIIYFVIGIIIGVGLDWLIQRWIRSFIFKLTVKDINEYPELNEYKTINLSNWVFRFGFYLLIGFLAVWTQLNPNFFNDILFITALTVIAQIDLKTMYIEGQIIAYAIILRLVWITYFEPQIMFTYLGGMFFGAGLLYFVSFFYQIFRNRQGLGDGDAAVLGLIGLWLGWENLWIVIMIASLSGIIISGFNLLIKKQKHQNISSLLKTKIPFAPFLCFGGLLVYIVRKTYYF